MNKSLLFVILFVALFIISSCSNGMNSVAPQIDSTNNDGQDDLSMPVDVASEDYKVDTRGVFGAWKVYVDTDNQTAEIVPARNANVIGDIFDADLSQFLNVSPCANCLQIPGISIDAFGDVVVDIAMRHPFDNILARPDLHGFDTRAIILMDRVDMTTFPDFGVTMPDGSVEDAEINLYGMGVLNADGYTSHYDELVTDERYFIRGIDELGNLNPFFRFFEDPTAGVFDPHSPSGYNVMPVGSPIETRSAVFNINLAEGGFYFYIVADVAYGHSATYLNRDAPEYYLPWFNRTEAWRVEYWLENNILTNDPTATVDLVVQIFDWQQGADVDTAYPDPANPDGIPQSSDVAEVELIVPGYQTSVITGIYESGTGAPDDPLQYRFTSLIFCSCFTDRTT